MLKSPVSAAISLAKHHIYRGARYFHSSRGSQVQRLLWAGSVLDRTASSLQEVPKDWLLSLGVQNDVEQGITFTRIAASPSHSLISYTTLPPSLPVSINDVDLDREEFGRRRTFPAGLQKIIAAGRNTYGELGLGFSSQESTWGMVTGGFEGKGGIQSLHCGLGTSWLTTSADLSSNSSSFIYAFGNHTLGQLGLGGRLQHTATSEGGESQLLLYSSPRRQAENDFEHVKFEKIAMGIDHTIVLVRKSDDSQSIYTCGLNTDGQLGDSSVRMSSADMVNLKREKFSPPLPSSVEDAVLAVAAGGDSSILWTKSGRVWAWGNNEYGQCLVNSTSREQILAPTEVDGIEDMIEGNVLDIRFGGCFIVLLDDLGNVYTAGFGAIGQGKDRLQSLDLKKILCNAKSISTGLEQASAVLVDPATKEERLMVWGLDSPAGRLGIGRRNPWPSYMIASRFTPQDREHRVWQPSSVNNWRVEWAGRGENEAGIKAVAHGRDVMWVLVEDGKDEIGRWASR